MKKQYKIAGLVSALMVMALAVGTVGIIGSRDTGTSHAATPLKVMPMGDSITDGIGWAPGAWRVSLWERLVTQEKFSFDFVGSLSNGPTSLGDKNHEGHNGWRIRDLRANVDNWMNTYKPDIVLLLIGSNDAEQNDDMANAPARLQDLIQRMCTDRPGIRVVVSTATPENGEPVDIPNFNAKIPGVVTTLNNNGCKTTMVDAFKLMSLSDLADTVHPTVAGHVKIANAFYPAFKALLQASGTASPSPTPSPTPAPSPVPVNAGTVNDDKFNYSGTWLASSNTSEYSGDDHYSSTTGSSYGLSFTGTQVKLYASKASHHGILSVKINNGSATLIDLYSASRLDQQLVYTSPMLSSGTHTITATVSGTKNGASSGTVVNADRIDVVTGGSASPTPSPTPTPTPSATILGDANGDGRVNALDLSILVTRDGQNYPAADFNKDGTVGSADLAILIGKWTW